MATLTQLRNAADAAQVALQAAETQVGVARERLVPAIRSWADATEQWLYAPTPETRQAMDAAKTELDAARAAFVTTWRDVTGADPA